MAFPTDRLPLIVEIAFGAAETDPLSWVWTELDSATQVAKQTMSPRRGRSDETGDTQPGTVSLLLDNAGGAFTPDNPNSPHWPNVIQGTPLRLSVEAGPTALRLSGAGIASTPDHPDFDVTDLDIRIRAQPDGWSTAVVWDQNGRTLSDHQRLVSRWGADGDRSWNLTSWSAGWPVMEWTTDGFQANRTLDFNRELIGATKPIWIGATLQVDNGAGGNIRTVYRYDGSVPPADVTTWEIVSQTVDTVSTTAVGNVTAGLVVGGMLGGLFSGSFRGRVLAFEQRDGINGTVIAGPDFTAQPAGTTSFADTAGKVWTLSGDAVIDNRRTVFSGTIDEWAPSWPHGDNEPGNLARPSEARVSITAAGILRRLSQGERPLKSTLLRHVKAPNRIDQVVAYWPCEDERGSVRIAGGTDGSGPMTVAGPLDTGSDDSLPAAGPLPKTQSGQTVTVSGAVTIPGPDNTWEVDWAGKLPTRVADPGTQMIAISAAGDVTEWQIWATETSLRIETFGPGGASVFAQSVAAPSWPSGWFLFRLEAAQNAGNIDWSWTILPLDDSPGAGGFSGSIPSKTLGRVLTVGNTVTGPPDGYSFGHIVVTDGTLGFGWLAGADTAWVGESAAHRFWRLCAEEAIPAEVIGDPTASSGTRGDLSVSQAMGPQQRLGLTELLRQCARADLGVIIERRGRPGLIYRCRTTIESQDPSMVLDASSNGRGDIIPPLDPKLDDQRLRNDVTVAVAGGTSAQATDPASIAKGRYETSITIAGIGGVTVQSQILAADSRLPIAVDEQARQQASWRLHLGTWPTMRYPAVTIDLAIADPAILEAFLDLELGDRVQLINLPVQHPSVIVELLVEGITSRVTPTVWQPQLTCSPGGPWLVGVLT